MDIKINQNFVCILNGLLVALGANMAEEAFQNGAWMVVVFPLGFGEIFGDLGGSWKGSWGLLGPKN